MHKETTDKEVTQKETINKEVTHKETMSKPQTEADTKTEEEILASKMLTMHPSEAIDAAWYYFQKRPWRWTGDSLLLNITSTIGNYDDIYEYPNEKELANEGLVNGDPVHFNQQLDILGTIKDLGYYPIFYYGSFEIDNHDFELCFEELKNHKIVFKPKKECAYRGL